MSRPRFLLLRRVAFTTVWPWLLLGTLSVDVWRGLGEFRNALRWSMSKTWRTYAHYLRWCWKPAEEQAEDIEQDRLRRQWVANGRRMSDPLFAKLKPYDSKNEVPRS